MRRRPIAAVILVIAGLLLLALLIAWSLRFRIASGIVERKLADAHVPASYRLTKVGPFLERMEDVRAVLDAVGSKREPNITVVEQRAGAEKDLEYEDAERRSSERGDHTEFQQHREHDLDGMEPRARRHVDVEVGMMHPV